MCQVFAGFATLTMTTHLLHLSVLGGGTNSIFGPGGVVDGIGSVIRNVQSGNILGAILGASNTYNNAKKIKKGDVKEELKGIGKDVVKDFGKQAGINNKPCGGLCCWDCACRWNNSFCQRKFRQQKFTKYTQ